MTRTEETAETVLRIAARGDGVTGDGRHVALTAPGDRVYLDGRIEAGPHHIEPPCRHFPVCGGCQLQMLDEESLAAFVTERAVYACEGQELIPAAIAKPWLSPPRSRRRATLHAANAAHGIAIGFNEARSHRIVHMKQCEVLHPDLFAMVAPLRTLLGGRIARARTAQIAMTLTEQGLDLVLKDVALDGLDAHEALVSFAQTHRLARISIDDGYGPEERWCPEPVTVRLGVLSVPFPQGAFLQPTPDGEAVLVDAVHEAVGDAAILADLFAGLGTFALALGEGRKVYAAEADQASIQALKSAVGRSERTLFVEHRDLFRRPLETTELNRFDAVVLDPPRAGARDQVERLAASDVARIAYVSCNPSSFARDARRLVDGGYRFKKLWPVGQFRWSTHIELVGSFVR